MDMNIKTKAERKNYPVIDLNKDNFDSTLTEKDLSLFSKGLTTDQQVFKYQNCCSNLIKLYSSSQSMV